MGRIITTLVLLVALGLGPLYGQIGRYISLRSESSIRNHAEIYFERQAYSHAAKLYQKIIREHPEDQKVKLRLGDSYRLLREPHNAAYWYGQVMQKDQSSAEHIFYYASVLCSIKKYQQAKFWYLEYLKANPNDQRAIAALSSLNNPQLLFDDRFEVKQLLIELPGAVFSPAIFEEGLVVVGEGNTGSLVKTLTTWNEGPYYDLYYVPLADGKPGYPKYLDDKLNSVLHEGPATFFEEGNKVIFTRSTFNKGDGDTRHLQLMIAERKSSGNWSSPRKLFRHENYSIGHPAVNKGGTTIYFSSNMPGGYGGTDIYRTDLINAVWQEPVNVGPGINTAGNELFPSLDEEGRLYFASNGLGGLGGLDIFKADLNGHNQPENLGFPINSQGDDFGIIWAPNNTFGYFSSNRKGIDGIFSFQLAERALAQKIN